MGGSQRAVWGDLGLECESPEPPRVEVDDAVLAPYAFLRELHYKVADGPNTVSIDFSGGEPRTEEGHIPEGLRVNWAGFLMELGMGRTFGRICTQPSSSNGFVWRAGTRSSSSSRVTNPGSTAVTSP